MRIWERMGIRNQHHHWSAVKSRSLWMMHTLAEDHALPMARAASLPKVLLRLMISLLQLSEESDRILQNRDRNP